MRNLKFGFSFHFFTEKSSPCSKKNNRKKEKEKKSEEEKRRWMVLNTSVAREIQRNENVRVTVLSGRLVDALLPPSTHPPISYSLSPRFSSS